MLAQFVSQISLHVIIHYHRKTAAAATRLQELEWNIDESYNTRSDPDILRKHLFKLDYEASTTYAVVRKWVSLLLALLSVAVGVLVICGCSIPSFSIESVGLLGLVESMNEFREADIYYSIFDLAKMIMDVARYLDTASNYIGLGTLSCLLVVTVFLVPMFEVASLLIEWFRPMDEKQRQRNSVVNEIISAWQYMEVFVLSVVIAAWQLGGVSEYIINVYCDSLEILFTTLSFYGILKEIDAQCFRVNASIEKAAWFLDAASLFLSYVNHFVITASSQMEQDKSVPPERRLHTYLWWTTQETMSLDEGEDGHEVLNNEVIISPVASQFTDFYFCTVRTGDCSEPSNAVLRRDEDMGVIKTPTEIETAKAFWDMTRDNNTNQSL
ncbi:hypothetical protein HJC23_010853 [Cyclotella cryptica]|uniref:Ion transport domain-containing protein n=1 Tax=Cyclotella cryptica TaxID=29204 RepID=A0ABD3QPH0_9STRA